MSLNYSDFEPLNTNKKIQRKRATTLKNRKKDNKKVQDMLEAIQHGQLILSSMFSKKNKYIVSINNDIVAVYEPFSEKYFKPDKVLI